jgi:hypothetical protein
MQFKHGEEVFKKGKAILKEVHGKGLLYLTNRRLVMENRNLPREERMALEIPIQALRKVETKGTLDKTLIIEADLAQRTKQPKPSGTKAANVVTYILDVDDPESWAEQLKGIIGGRQEKKGSG